MHRPEIDLSLHVELPRLMTPELLRARTALDDDRCGCGSGGGDRSHHPAVGVVCIECGRGGECCRRCSSDSRRVGARQVAQFPRTGTGGAEAIASRGDRIAGPNEAPRRFEPDEERSLLLDASVKVIRRKGYQGATVEEVLAEAGVSSRAFYRHFGGKDELLLALLRNDAEAFAASLQDRVAAAADPIEAIEEWIDGYLDLLFVPRRAALGDLHVRGSPRCRRLQRRARTDARSPRRAARGSARRGPCGRAADLIGAVPRCEDRPRHRRGDVSVLCETKDQRLRAEARAAIVRFCWPGLGLQPVDT